MKRRQKRKVEGRMRGTNGAAETRKSKTATSGGGRSTGSSKSPFSTSTSAPPVLSRGERESISHSFLFTRAAKGA